MVIVTDKHAEIPPFRGVGAECPADSGLVEHLCIPFKREDVRFSEEIGGGCDEQDISSLDVCRQLDIQPCFLFQFFLDKIESVPEGRARHAEVVADRFRFIDNLEIIL